jgi:hypothetical protein
VDIHRLTRAPASRRDGSARADSAPADSAPADPPAAGAPSARARAGGASAVVTVAAVVALVVVAGVAVAALVFHLGGGHWFVVTSSSMGRAAPVGTLVLTEPVAVPAGGPDTGADRAVPDGASSGRAVPDPAASDRAVPDGAASDGDALRVGDVISFRPPGAGDTVYTHRVASIGADGVRTAGDTTGTVDPWLLGPSDVVGRAVALLPGVGTLLRALPWLAGGALVIHVLSLRVRAADRRGAFRVLATCLLVSVVTAVQRPFVGADLLSTTVGDGRGWAHVVSTGLAPIRVRAEGGGHVDLVSGAVGSVALSPTGGRADLVAALGLSPLGWAVIALVCCAPLLGVLVVGLPARRPPRHVRVEEAR